MTKEQLEALGLDEEQIKEVFKLNGLAVNAQKTEADNLRTQLEESQNNLKAIGAELEDLKQLDPEGLQKQIGTLQQDLQAKATEHEQLVKDLKLNSAIELALSGVVHDVSLASSLLDREKLVFGEGDKIIGLEDQINNLKETKGFMFVGESKESGFQRVGLEGKEEPLAVNQAIAAAFGNIE